MNPSLPFERARVDLPPPPATPDAESASRQREAMVNEQLLPRGIRDARVIEAMRRIPRHLFVPESERASAYADHPLPIGWGQTISQPFVVAFMVQCARIPPGARVLDVGAGSGFQAAVLGEMGVEVHALEIVPELAHAARERLALLGYSRVHVYEHDGYLGLPEEAPFDAILAAAAPERVPPPLLDQLKVGARLVMPVGGDRDVQQLTIVTRTAGGFTEDQVLAVRFVPMTGRAAAHGTG